MGMTAGHEDGERGVLTRSVVDRRDIFEHELLGVRLGFLHGRRTLLLGRSLRPGAFFRGTHRRLLSVISGRSTGGGGR